MHPVGKAAVVFRKGVALLVGDGAKRVRVVVAQKDARHHVGAEDRIGLDDDERKGELEGLETRPAARPPFTRLDPDLDRIGSRRCRRDIRNLRAADGVVGVRRRAVNRRTTTQVGGRIGALVQLARAEGRLDSPTVDEARMRRHHRRLDCVRAGRVDDRRGGGVGLRPALDQRPLVGFRGDQRRVDSTRAHSQLINRADERVASFAPTTDGNVSIVGPCRQSTIGGTLEHTVDIPFHASGPVHDIMALPRAARDASIVIPRTVTPPIVDANVRADRRVDRIRDDAHTIAGSAVRRTPCKQGGPSRLAARVVVNLRPEAGRKGRIGEVVNLYSGGDLENRAA